MIFLKENDLIICKDKYNGHIDDFTVFARVAEVDRKKGIAFLDRYQKKGRFHYDSEANVKMSLNIIEDENSYYFKMTDEEVLMFCKGLEEMRKISQRNKEYKRTLEVVQNAADSINSNNYWKSKLVET